MIITHLAVEGVGRFRSRHVLRGLDTGLNLLCAPNEAGKSTLFRALHLALFARHGSKTEEMRRLGSLGAELPACVEVGFKRGGADYLVKKSFLRSTGAKLYKNGTLVADGRAADEAVWTALDLTPGTSAAEEAAFGLLWVRQGQSFRPAEPDEGTRALLSRVIEAEVGEVLGGERGERVLRRVADRLAEDETARGQPKAGGPWKAALDRRAEAERTLAELRRTLDALEADRTALTDKLRERALLADPAETARQKADRDAALAERDAGARAEQAAQQAGTEEAQRELAADRARKRHEELVGLDQRIARTREKIAALTRRAAEQSAAKDAQAARLAAQEQAFGALATRLAEAERAVDRARRRETAARDAERVAEISARLVRARELREHIARIRQLITTLAVPADAVKAIETAMQALDAARARAEAKAPRVRVTIGPAGAGRVTCAGEAVDGTRDIAAVAPVTVAVGDLATVEIVPAASDDAAAIEGAREQLARALREAGVASLAEAHERRARAADLQTEGRGLAAELAATAPVPGPGPAKGGKEDGIALLEKALAEAQAGLETGSDSGAPLPDRDTLARERAAAEAARDRLRREHADAQSAVLAARSEAEAETLRLQALQLDLADMQTRLGEDLAVCPDDRRAERLVSLAAEAAQARAAFDAATRRAAELRAAVPTADQRTALDARVRRLTQAIDGRERRLAEVERDIANLQGRIATRGGEGLGEREAETADALALAETEVAAIERRLAALRLLRDAVTESRRAARDSYLAPVKTAMRPYLHALFPGADAALDASFAIDGLTRAGADEPFVSLSDGTREQVAIIVRLALGRLLAERGQAVPVLLDDSLVFSDDDRIERMFDVLTQAAEKQQVIVLTCRSRAFLSCGGRALTIERDDA
ncbi:AAA family ATPase [Rhodoplanes sp. TEM]|uniref:AAA family ATPase n=1 Tax=Rhodoplanes tepidamans TaxID=200616 RepID=A0ABT5J9G2_RHOTP|nr:MULTISPECIES: AAA family ATPase [Rhodoplanes]MDC7786138.1 AAA family ATPase [Rhodoplanes tepidamans]MDC7982805.1 AAA family ATPase [Rhodoplanes sp. TEM]MDQ0357197.1 DNA repair exonuclease SbcCD ATPase subunit [Rhodoplanes tepidamans]